jgi:hypothetical protein
LGFCRSAGHRGGAAEAAVFRFFLGLLGFLFVFLGAFALLLGLLFRGFSFAFALVFLLFFGGFCFGVLGLFLWGAATPKKPIKKRKIKELRLSSPLFFCIFSVIFAVSFLII